LQKKLSPSGLLPFLHTGRQVHGERFVHHLLHGHGLVGYDHGVGEMMRHFFTAVVTSKWMF
jgi:hypothetical protein